MVEEAVSGVGERGFRFEGRNKVFLDTGESGAEGHTHTKTTLAYDRIAADSRSRPCTPGIRCCTSSPRSWASRCTARRTP
ncbi:hypothetical protein GCM10009800_20590 [Nocardiopsis rhodophaea]